MRKVMSFIKSPLGLLVIGLLLILIYSRIRAGVPVLGEVTAGVDHPQVTRTPVVSTNVAATGENIN